ncbi:MAG: hypothetical protein IJ334_01015 [Clostridia bacterium]|nr:hypothetical protein [Clostridia bacterium]
MNDHLNETNLPEDGLSPDELDLLREALDTAWPPPKHSIRDGVMAQVKRERTAAKRRRLLSRTVKYGSLAACLVLVTLAGFRILPSLTSKSAEMADAGYVYTTGTAAPAEIFPESALQNTSGAADDADSAETVPATILFSTMSTAEEPAAPVTEEAPAETVPETEAAPSNKMMFAAAPAETAPETAAPEMESPEMEAEYEADIMKCEAEEVFSDTLTAVSDTAACPHSGVFADSYHTIPEIVIACTGEDVYLAWLDGTEGCDRSIAGYMDYMEENTHVLLSDIEMIYDATDLWYRFDWNFDLLESDDIAAIEDYYQSGGNFAEMVKRDTEYRFKLALLDETGAEKSVDVCAWSIADLVEEEKMTLSTLTAVYEASADEVEEDYPGYAAQEYDLAALHDYAYSEANDAETPPGAIAHGRHEDELFRITPVK